MTVPVAELVSAVVIPLSGYIIQKVKDIESDRKEMNRKQNTVFLTLGKAINGDKQIDTQKVKDFLFDGDQPDESVFYKED